MTSAVTTMVAWRTVAAIVIPYVIIILTVAIVSCTVIVAGIAIWPAVNRGTRRWWWRVISASWPAVKTDGSCWSADAERHRYCTAATMMSIPWLCLGGITDTHT
jgi:hypothetical protein